MYRVHGMKYFPHVGLWIYKVTIDNIIRNRFHPYSHVVQYKDYQCELNHLPYRTPL